MTFSAKLKLWRGDLSQHNAAKKLGVKYGTYINWEVRQKQPTHFTKQQVLKLIEER